MYSSSSQATTLELLLPFPIYWAGHGFKPLLTLEENHSYATDWFRFRPGSAGSSLKCRGQTAVTRNNPQSFKMAGIQGSSFLLGLIMLPWSKSWRICALFTSLSASSRSKRHWGCQVGIFGEWRWDLVPWSCDGQEVPEPCPSLWLPQETARHQSCSHISHVQQRGEVWWSSALTPFCILVITTEKLKKQQENFMFRASFKYEGEQHCLFL